MIRRTGFLLLLGLMVACTPPDDQETGSISQEEVRQSREDLPAELVAALDSGNAAYRRGDYNAALSFYDQAIEMDGGVAAGWFGVYMAQSALGNPEAADSALVRARDLAPGATLIHPEQETP